jgi:hypothetical protein
MAQANAHSTSVAHTGPVITLAKFYARKRVIADFQAAGIRYLNLGQPRSPLPLVPYLSGPHGPELIQRATETLAEWAERDRLRREMRRQLRRSYINSAAQNARR